MNRLAMLDAMMVDAVDRYCGDLDVGETRTHVRWNDGEGQSGMAWEITVKRINPFSTGFEETDEGPMPRHSA